jgi:hypothetical protein
MIAYFEKRFRGNHDKAVKCAAERLGMLIITANLSSIGKAEFATLCSQFSGIATEGVLDGKKALLGALQFALTEQDEFRVDIADKRFADETPETRELFLQKLDGERQHLSDLAAVIDELDEGACVALLTRIEEVHAGGGDDLYGRCIAVHDKMQDRRQL